MSRIPSRRPRRLTGALTAVLAALLGFAGPQSAMAEEAQAGVLEEIIVTGTKREASQQDTPIAVSTITANDIAKTFGNDIRAVGDLSPNVNLTLQTGFNALAGGIRGTGTISILTTQDPSVGILIDEFALNHVQTQFVELFDLEQVEIYRGPQGTLFGKNSTGGTIVITSKRPDLDEAGADVRASLGGYDGGSDNKKVQVGIDVPLIPGQLGFRFAGSYAQEDGFYTNDKDTALFPNGGLFPLLGIGPDDWPPELSLATTGAGEALGGKEVFAAKAKLLWQPNERYEGYFIYEVIDDNSDSPPGVNETPAGEGFVFELLGFPGIQAAGHGNPFSTGVTQQGNGINIRDGHRVNVNGYYFNQSIAFERFSIKSITGYREQRETLPSTYTGEAFVSLFDATRNLEREQFQQEVRLISEFDGPFNFVAGGIYLQDDLDFRAYTSVGISSLFSALTAGRDDRGYVAADLRNVSGDLGAGRVKQRRDSIAFYVDGSYDVTDRLTISAGARWTQDEKLFNKPINGTGPGPCNQYTEARDAVLADPSQPFNWQTNCAGDVRSGTLARVGLTGHEVDQRRAVIPDSQYALLVNSKEKWDEVTWRLVADYAITDDSLGYLSVATGFLAGGYSETCGQPITCIAYNPETNINIEAGYKADLLDDRLRLNIAAFYTMFDDLQRNQVFAFTNADGSPGQETITLNAGESTAAGIEAELTWLLTDNLQIRGSLGWLNAEYDEFEFNADPAGIFGVAPVDLSSLDIPFAAEWQLGAEAILDTPLGNGAALIWRAGFHYQSDAETSPFDPNAADPRVAGVPQPGGTARHPTFTKMEERVLVNADITYMSPDEQYYFTLFGKNLLNEEYRVSANSVGALWNFTQYGAPLQWGLEFGVNF